MSISGVAGLLSTFSSSSGSSVFGTLASAPTTAVFDSILQNQKVELTRNRIFNEVGLRLQYIREGTLAPDADWEKIAGFFAATGQPFAVSLNDKGQVEIAHQADSDLGRFTADQQRRLKIAFDELAGLAGKVQANAQNRTLVEKLEGAGVVLEGIRSGQLAAAPGWETEASHLAARKTPFKVVLDGKGELSVLDQSRTDLPEVPDYQKPLLRAAIAELKQVISTDTGTKDWHFEALSLAGFGIGFHLDIDRTTGRILVKTQTGSDIVPDFLREDPYPDLDRGLDAQWKRDAAALIEAGKGFFLDFDPAGRMVVKENAGPNIIQYNQPKNILPASAALLVSMLA